ncbi:hypothetical protein ACLMAL_20535 [Nocardia sp. CWNU-33]|uniref:hypothetical protein n=1 Tax=Nocardia sp. CWNU-33 TaxID=3392117 RepID=UPI00398E7B14
MTIGELVEFVIVVRLPRDPRILCRRASFPNIAIELRSGVIGPAVRACGPKPVIDEARAQRHVGSE